MTKYLKRSLILQYSFAQKPHSFCEPHFTIKIMCPYNAAKKLSDFKNFPADMFLFGVRKTFALYHFLIPKNCIIEVL